MKVPGNWEDLLEKCQKQDEFLKRRYHLGQSWYDIISENFDRSAGNIVYTRQWLDVWFKEQSQTVPPRD